MDQRSGRVLSIGDRVSWTLKGKGLIVWGLESRGDGLELQGR